MMRVLLLSKYDRMGASSRLRSYQYLPYLKQNGVDVTVSPLFYDGYVRDHYKHRVSRWRVLLAYMSRLYLLSSVGSYDLVWVEKEALPWLPACIELFFLRRIATIAVDYDDAVFHRYDGHHSALIRLLLGRKIDRIMAASDLVIAGSEYLIERARVAGAARIEKLPTVVDLTRYDVRSNRRNEGDVTIGWIGSPGTESYLLPLLPVFRLLQQRYGVRIVAVGANERKEFRDLLEVRPWSESTEVALLCQLDVGIMPLPDAPFERGKCAYKLIQYMASGKPIVASPIGENVVAVRSNVNGFLASSESEWLAALTKFCNDTLLRERCGKAGRAIAEKKYSLAATAPRLLAIFKSMNE